MPAARPAQLLSLVAGSVGGKSSQRRGRVREYVSETVRPDGQNVRQARAVMGEQGTPARAHAHMGGAPKVERG